MRNIKIALTEKRKTECTISIFPKEYYDIPELCEFQDIRAVRNYAYKVLEPYAEQSVDIILNGGMLIEILCAMQAAVKLNISFRVLHYDRDRNIYVPQTITWDSVLNKKVSKEKEESEEITKDIHTMDLGIEKFILCAGRHYVEGNQYPTIFEMIPPDKLFDFSWQEEQAEKVLKTVKQKKVLVYLTGLTQITLSVLNVAYRLGISVTFLHYDFDTEEYFPQKMDDL